MKNKQKIIKNKIVIPLLIIACILLVGQQASANSQSVNVAIIGSPGVINGGTFPTNGVDPTSGLDFSSFTFSNLHPNNVNSQNLASYDTVLLNVASSEMGCNINTLSAQAKTDLVSFVGNGGKLIIYDSECSAQDYSWLPYPFTTNNPGAMGAQGTLTIVEENTLSTSNSSDAHYVDAATLGSSTDAVGDMNVMTTYDPNWCLDMSGTNINGITGPVHTYARNSTDPTKEGLIIYNGLDVDYMGYYDPTGGNGLEKIWLQELKQDFNPSTLTCGIPVVGIALTPQNDTNEVGEDHAVTATLTDLLGNPQSGILVTFSVISGPNAGTTGTCSPTDCKTDANGEVSFTYTGAGGVGTDQIEACFNDIAGNLICSQIVTKEWIITNKPPIADAGKDQVVEQDNLGGASVTLNGSGSSDPDGDPLTYTWTWTGGSANGVSPIISLQLGATTITLVVNDGTVDSAPDTVIITVQDTTAPVITCPGDLTVEQETAAGTEVSLTATATDICDADVGITDDAPVIFPLGTTTVTFTATDDSGNSATCTTTVTVVDTTPPEIVLSDEQIDLWPPNHKYRTIEIDNCCVISVTDICDADVDIDDVVITSVSSDEPENDPGTGDGNTVNDIIIKDSQTVDLRAERQGNGNGRVYTINFEVTDASGNTQTGSCTVWVVHDQMPNDTAIDDGASAGYTVYP